MASLGGGFGGSRAYSGLSSSRTASFGGTSSRAGSIQSPARQPVTRVPNTYDVINPGNQGQMTYSNPSYGSNMEEHQIQARPDGTYLQTQRKWDPTTGTYATVGVQTGGDHTKQTVTQSGGPGGYDDLDVEDFYRAKGVLPNLPPREKPPSQADRTAAEAAAYGRAKDKIGLNAAAGLRAIQGLMASRGISGSGIEAALSEGAVGGALGQLGEVARDQAITGLQRDWEVEDRDWAGNIQQRGQDISGLNARNADIFRLMEMTRRRRPDQPLSTTTERWVY